ncbi:MAG: quinone oxidoreductase family protein [Leucobacter sp.]
MRAIIANQAGGPEVLRYQETASPELDPGDLLVETLAVGVNFIDTYKRSGTYSVDCPFTPGTEAVGRVIAVGDGVQSDSADGFAVGDRIITAEGRKTYAEQFTVPATGAVRIPESLADGLSNESAAALPLQGTTAHYLATSAAHANAGDTVLLHAGAGGVGLLLTQLLTAREVRVITTASTPLKRKLSLGAGAIESIEYAGFGERVRELTDGAGVAVVYDGVGKNTFDESLASLRVRGEFVLFGASSGPVPPLELQRLAAGGSLSITRPTLGDFLLTEEERAWRYRELFEAVQAGALTLRVGATFPLAEAAAAHTALESRATTGKVVLVP